MSYNSYKQSSRGGYGGRGGGYGGYSGGYRGSNRGSGDSGWRGGRGYSNSNARGRFTSRFEKDNAGSYDSRPRYSGGVSDGFSTREDNSHRRYRDDSMYSGRDRSHRASSPDRKRLRTDFSPATSMHRSHDYGEGIDYSNRSYGGYGDMEVKRVSRGYAGDDRRSFRDDRERMRSDDDYQYRKSTSALAGPRHSTPRGLFRGRTFSRSRGVGRSSFKRNESYRGYLAKKRALMDSIGFRKRGVGSKTQEYLQRLKLYRLKSKLGREKLSKSDDEEDDEDKDIDDEEEEVEEEVEEEIEEEVTDDGEGDEEMEEGEQKEDDEEKKDAEEELEEGETNDDTKKQKKMKKVKKIIKVVKKVKKRKIPVPKDSGSGNEECENSKNEGSVQVTIKQDSETRAVNDDSVVRKNRQGKPFIRLECPHCHGVYVTFKEYTNHLFTQKHISTMTKLTLRLRQTLAKMRVDQRKEQRIIDEESKLQKSNMRTLYCLTCKLNYRSLKADHISSEKHSAMREFLTPYCKVCRIFFKTPMVYQHHLCQLDHIRLLASKERRNAEKDDGKEVDIDQFMILDSVGSGEEGESEETEDETGEKKEPVEGEEQVEKEPKKKKKKKKSEIGIEHCKKVEVFFCELCKFYLPRLGEEENILAQHCRSRNHLHRYVRYRDDQALRKRAERLQKLREEAKKKDEEEKMQKDESMEVDDEKNEGTEKSSSGTKSSLKTSGKKVIKVEGKETEVGLDKMWSEVDKDLGKLLREVDKPLVDKSSDDDDSRAGDGRYDRFKNCEKEKHLPTGKEDDEDLDEEVIDKDESIKKVEMEDEEMKNVAVEVNGEEK